MKLLFIILILLACYFVVFFVYTRLSKSTKAHIEDSYIIMRSITTNNTYTPILDVLLDLDAVLPEDGKRFHADLRGYLRHE